MFVRQKSNQLNLFTLNMTNDRAQDYDTVDLIIYYIELSLESVAVIACLCILISFCREYYRMRQRNENERTNGRLLVQIYAFYIIGTLHALTDMLLTISSSPQLSYFILSSSNIMLLVTYDMFLINIFNQLHKFQAFFQNFLETFAQATHAYSQCY